MVALFVRLGSIFSLFGIGTFAYSQSLSAVSQPFDGWQTFAGLQLAMLDDAGPSSGILNAGPSSADALIVPLSGDGLSPLLVGLEVDPAADLYFSNDLLVLEPWSPEAKIIAQILKGTRPWPTAIPKDRRANLTAIYERREFQPLWLKDQRWRPGLDAALYRVEQARLEGLNGEDYSLDTAYGYIAANDA